MARTKNTRNGRVDRVEEEMSALRQAQTNLVQAHAALEQAMATLAQNRAAFLARIVELDARFAETKRISDERFARIEAILLEHSRILRALPDAIRDKIGFKTPPPQANE